MLAHRFRETVRDGWSSGATLEQMRGEGVAQAMG